MSDEGVVRPLNFLRRFLATVIDVLIAFVISFVISIPFVALSDGFRFAGAGYNSQVCQRAVVEPHALRDVFPITAQSQSGVCRVWSNGFYNGLDYVAVSVERLDDGTVVTRNLRVPINEQGQVSFPFPIQDFVYVLLLVFGGGWLVAHGFRTPGKWALGLVVVNPLRPYRRDALKYCVSVLSVGISVIALLAGETITIQLLIIAMQNVGSVVAAAVVFGIVALWYFVYPIFFIGSGRMFWDIWTGSYVDRKSRKG